MSAVLDRLRPHPHRGDVIAAGAVPLALAAIVIELRMTQWALGARFTVVAVIAVLLLTMGWLAPLEGESPRRYHSLLLVSGLLPLIVALQLLAEVLGAARPPGDGALAWTFVVEAMIAAAAARRANSAICTLISALAAVISVQAFVAWLHREARADAEAGAGARARLSGSAPPPDPPQASPPAGAAPAAWPGATSGPPSAEATARGRGSGGSRGPARA